MKYREQSFSLTALFIVLMVIGLLAVQIAVFWVTIHLRDNEQYRMAASDRARLAISQYELFNALGPLEREKLLEKLKFVSFSLELLTEPTMEQDSSWQSTYLLARLSELYTLSYKDIAPSTPHFRASVRHFDIAWRVETNVKIDDTGQPLYLSKFDADVELPLADGTWLHIKYNSVPLLGGSLVGLLTELTIQFFLQVLLAVVIIQYLTRPLRELADFADRLTPEVPEEEPEGLPIRGSSEVRRAAQAFHAMYKRIRTFVDERMRLVASISHDLRTPITRLRLQLEGEPSLEHPDLVFDALDDLQNLAEDAITLARTGTNNEPVYKIDMALLLESLVADYEEYEDTIDCFEAGSGCRLQLHLYASGQCMLRIKAFRRCLDNLIDNALTYGKRADIFLEAVPDRANMIQIRIEDQGDGIPDKHLEQVFQPFFRVDGSRNQSTGGVGLGLSIARELAALNHVELKLSNKPEGGLRVTLLLENATTQKV